MPKASDKKPRAHSLSSLALPPPPFLYPSFSLYIRHRANRRTILPIPPACDPSASTLVVSPPPASVKNAAAKQRGGITKQPCSIFIPPSFDDKVRRKEGESFCLVRERGEGGKTKAAANSRVDSTDFPVRSTKGVYSLSESGIHRRTLSSSMGRLEVLTREFEIPSGSRERQGAGCRPKVGTS